MSSTPQKKSAHNIRKRMQSHGESIAKDPTRSQSSRLIFGSSLARTVNQNYGAAVEQLKLELDKTRGSHLSTEVLQSAMRGLVSQAIWDEIEDFGELLARCESPAEELFLIALGSVIRTRPIEVHYKRHDYTEDDVVNDVLDAFREEDEAFVIIEPQGQVWPEDKVVWGTRPYRADFLIQCTKRSTDRRSPIILTRTAIEIDGRHHASDERRSRDNERNRVFAELGIETDRYTGVDILSDPFACASRAIDHFLAL